ncbi:hypothetical protein SAMN05518670_3677 [Paenibacillus sp. OK076]|nr:hypothetical protein SAMN05518670_3677 [Paenibacillus sp. OK076]
MSYSPIGYGQAPVVQFAGNTQPPYPPGPITIQRHQRLLTFDQQKLRDDAATAETGTVPPDPIGPPPTPTPTRYLVENSPQEKRIVPVPQLLACSGKWANIVIGANVSGPVLSPAVLFINIVRADGLGRPVVDGWFFDPLTGIYTFYLGYPAIWIQVIWC